MCVCVCVCVCGVCLYIVPCWTYNQDPLEAFKVSVAIRLFLCKEDLYHHEKISIAMSKWMIELNGLRGEPVGGPKLWFGQRERNGQIQKAEETGSEG